MSLEPVGGLYCSVVVGFSEELLPLTDVLSEEIRSELLERFSFDSIDVNKDNGTPRSVECTGGVWEVGERRAAIRRVFWDDSSAYAQASTRTAGVKDIIWAVLSTASNGSHDKDDLSGYVEVERYATTCKLDLGLSIEAFLSPDYVEFVRENITKRALPDRVRDRFQVKMYPYSVESRAMATGEDPNAPAVTAYSGFYDFDISLAGYKDAQRGRYITSSPFDYATHLDVFAALKDRFSGEDGSADESGD